MTDETLRATLRSVASALKSSGVGFALAGGYALWVHGAQEPVHDVDFVVAENDADLAAAALAEAGLRVERPPEDWLFKVYLDEAMADILHRLAGVPVDEAQLARAEEREVLGLRMPVLPPMDIVVAKLESLTERHCDFEGLLAGVRATREQLDWDVLHDLADGRPFVEAFLLLADRLGIRPGSTPVERVTGATPSSGG